MPIYALRLTWMVFGLSWDVHPVEAGAHVRAHNVRATVHRDGRPMGVQRRLQNVPAFTQPVLDLCSSLVLRRNLHGTDRWRRCSDLGRGEPRAPLQPCEEAALPKHPGSLQSDLVAGVLSAGTSFVGLRLRDDNAGTYAASPMSRATPSVYVCLRGTGSRRHATHVPSDACQT